jgi:hypothetical protein
MGILAEDKGEAARSAARKVGSSLRRMLRLA